MTLAKLNQLNPQAGEVWEHMGGGEVRVLDRKAKERGEERQWIRVSRQGPHDARENAEWIPLRQFGEIVTRRLR